MYISRFETQISRFFPTHFPNIKVWEFQRLEGLNFLMNCIQIKEDLCYSSKLDLSQISF